MITRTKAIMALAIGATILAAGSAVALETMGSDPAGMPGGYGFQGFSDGSKIDGWNCSTNGMVTNVALSFRSRDGVWEPANNDFSQFAWASCQNSWSFGYLNGADKSSDLARVEGIDPATLPIMR
jgi:hypothetical protein